jgi:hypothetical protein
MDYKIALQRLEELRVLVEAFIPQMYSSTDDVQELAKRIWETYGEVGTCSTSSKDAKRYRLRSSILRHPRSTQITSRPVSYPGARFIRIKDTLS